MPKEIANIPTNLIMGFLGVGKTTAIIDLLKQKPKDENWAVLVNEFGKVGIDGALFSAAGATVKEIPGGCLCCAVNVPFHTGINQLLKAAKPDRLLIEPTGLGHPKKVLAMLGNDSFKKVLDLRASICLVDPEKLKDPRYTENENFVDQIALSDVLVANKLDLADSAALELFHLQAETSQPTKALIAQTVQGQLDIEWLDLPRNTQRQASFPNAHQNATPTAKPKHDHRSDDYQSLGYIFPPQSCFDYLQLTRFISQLNVERIKGIFCTDKGWFIFNNSDENINSKPTSASANSRIEIIATKDNLPEITSALNQCRIDNNEA